MSGAAPWWVQRAEGPAGALHAPWPDAERAGHRAVRLCAVDGPALVLGSAQPEGVVDRARASTRGVEVVRRAAGGGAVLVDRGAQVWFDTWVPRADDLWDDDIVRAARWLGALWCRALDALGVPDAVVHSSGATGGALAGTVCFAGLGPGEVTVAGRKLVGVAQRRTRAGARFLSVAHRRWDALSLLTLLVLEGVDAGMGTTLADAATGLDDVLGCAPDSPVVATVEDALVRALP